MTDVEIEKLVHDLENGSLPRGEWTHARHLLVALWYVRLLGAEEAAGKIRDAIRRYNARQGNHTGYHETVTLAWVAVIERFLAARGADEPVSALAAGLLHEFGGKDYLLRYYTRDRLFSDEARARWVPPDLLAIHDARLVRGAEVP